MRFALFLLLRAGLLSGWLLRIPPQLVVRASEEVHHHQVQEEQGHGRQDPVEKEV